MIHKFVDFMWVTAAVLALVSLALQVKRDMEEIKAYQTTQLFMLEKITLMQNMESKQLKELKNETSRN